MAVPVGRRRAPRTSFEQLREALADARATGLPFDEAWPAVTAGVMDADVREATASAWRRAYELQPATRTEAAVARLGVFFERAGAV